MNEKMAVLARGSALNPGEARSAFHIRHRQSAIGNKKRCSTTIKPSACRAMLRGRRSSGRSGRWRSSITRTATPPRAMGDGADQAPDRGAPRALPRRPPRGVRPHNAVLTSASAASPPFARSSARKASIPARSGAGPLRLLAGNVAQAMESYERLVSAHSGYDLSHHLELRDWVDCKFLLAEEYQRRSDFERALGLYEDLYHSERRRAGGSRTSRTSCATGSCTSAAATPRRPARRPSRRNTTCARWPSSCPPAESVPPQESRRVPPGHRRSGLRRRHLEIAFRLRPGLKGGEDLPQAFIRAGACLTNLAKVRTNLRKI